MIPETMERIKNSERAVSPVIGVILMVAITVILAAVIAAFVLGFGADQDSAPQATWSMSDTVDTDVILTITHDGGDATDAENLYLRGAGMDEINLGDAGSVDEFRGGVSEEYNLGNTFTGNEIRLVWEVGDDSSTLRSYTLDSVDSEGNI